MSLGWKRARWVSLFALSLAAAGCGDDDDGGNPPAENPGGAGQGGSAGTGGSAGGGAGGTAGAGAGGAAGAGAGGAGAGGEAGAAGSGAAGAGGDAGAGGAGAGGAGAGGEAGAGAGGAGNGGAGGGVGAILPGPSRGAPIALSPDDTRAVVVNRDVGTVTVLAIDYSSDPPSPTKLAEIDLGKGSEPWQAVVHPDGGKAFVVLKKSGKLVQIDDLQGSPKKGAEVAVGSEPTAVALTPTGAAAWVANWVDGTLMKVDTTSLQVASTVDLNDAMKGPLGVAEARPALSHPRSIAISNDGDADDADEKLVVTEYYAVRSASDGENGADADTSKRGFVHVVSLADSAIKTIELAPIEDMGFRDHRDGIAGCYPNQLQSVTVNGSKAYVVSVCASPRGPVGVFTGPTVSCSDASTCPAPAGVVAACNAGSCSTQCDEDKDCGAVGGKCDLSNGRCLPNVASVKTTTAPAVHVVDLESSAVVGKASLNAEFDKLYTANGAPDDGGRRYPLLADDLAFVPGTGIGYLPANGTDAVFRVVYDGATGGLTQVGATSNSFIDLHPAAITDPNKGGRNPIGFVVTNLDHGGKKFGFSANDVSRDVSVVDFSTQAVAGGNEPVFIATSALPAAGSPEDRVRLGKRFFNTGLGRWSMKGQGWGACQSCHVDGLSDNVTWYFARGPRQSTSLDGSFSKKNPADQRIFNWTAIFDEVADFEGNTRGVSGGVGAIVKATSAPPANGDRIDLAAVPVGGQTQNHAGLNGSAEDVADKSNPLGIDTPSSLEDWAEITEYMRTIRAPQAPSNLDPAQVAAGRDLFQGANCQGCHGGDKWTVSSLFYNPTVATTGALKTATWTKPGNLPAAVLPSTDPTKQLMRAGNAANDQLLCVLRNVGTFNASEPELGVSELRADMSTPAQGDAADARGFNPPSLLGMSVGAPYFHNGGARSLEGAFTEIFGKHHRSLSENFLLDDASGAKRKALVQFLLSIDDGAQAFPVPASGGAAPGGVLCKTP
jgi:hypothetical protein